MPDTEPNDRTKSIFSQAASNAIMLGGITLAFGVVAATLTGHVNSEALKAIAVATAGMAAFGFCLGAGSGIGMRTIDFVGGAFRCAIRRIRSPDPP